MGEIVNQRSLTVPVYKGPGLHPAIQVRCPGCDSVDVILETWQEPAELRRKVRAVCQKCGLIARYWMELDPLSMWWKLSDRGSIDSESGKRGLIE